MLSLAIKLRCAAYAALLLAGTSSAATTVTPSNETIPLAWTFANLTVAAGGQTLPEISVLPLSTSARDVQNQPQHGYVFLANSSNYLSINASNIVFISCENTTSNIGAVDIYNQASTVNPAGIIFYTTTGNWCHPQPIDSLSYHFSYTMTSMSDTVSFLAATRSVGGTAILGANHTTDSTIDSANGPQPTTALAMIILYAITGTITALFILIIITGTIRAHRHPERYGPSTVNGRTRRTRAGGLARAMLDTIPVVKFGGGTPVKQDDIELGPNDANHTPEQPEMQKTNDTVKEETEGIAAASSSAGQTVEAQGCSICTEDFEIGQDQRVLPCDHCFHPACIDPWLLNVSGTCPLCRIDLRSPEEQQGAEGASETSPVIPPPASRRRSVLMAITGLRRPDGMSREERLQALRQYRIARQSEEPQAVEGAPVTPAEDQTTETTDESRIRQRLRQMFNVRTRRTAV